MLTVASGALVVINTSIAAVCAAVVGAASGGAGAVPFFFTRLNYVEIGRSAFALWADRSYIYEDVEQQWEWCQASKVDTDVAVHVPMGEEVQRVVESLYMLWLKDDCHREKNDKQHEYKEVLIGAWVRRQRITHDGSQGGCFLDAADVYRELEAVCAGEGGELVRLAIAQQLLAYRPYATEKKLSLSQTWLTDVFISDQGVIDSETLKRLRDACASYDRWFSGTYTKWVVRGAVAVTATAATGGVVAVAAPAVVTAPVGEAVVGLSGATLTSMSLVRVDGGSLATRGLGMAGGTAIIMGGGAALGLTAASSGAALVGAFSKDYAERVKQGCIERFAQCSVFPEENPAQVLRAIEDSKARLERAIDVDERTIDALKGAKEKDEKKLRQSLNEGVSHLRYTADESGKLGQKACEVAAERDDFAPSGSTDIARVPESDQCDLSAAGGRTFVGRAYPRGTTPEIIDPAVRVIAEKTAADPVNVSYTKRGVGPLFHAGPECRVMIVGQAPGRVVEETGAVWNDCSGDRLCDWMGVDRDTFYEPGRLAIIPMNLYFPGTGRSGDLPPRKDFADTWHPRLLELVSKLEMMILVGAYATKRYFGLRSSVSLTEVARDHERYLPTYFPLVHPSPHNQMWMKKNPWFAVDMLPDLKARAASLPVRQGWGVVYGAHWNAWTICALPLGPVVRAASSCPRGSWSNAFSTLRARVARAPIRWIHACSSAWILL